MINNEILWKLITYLKDGTYDNEDLDYSLRLVADSEKQVSTNFFKNTLDQVCFEKDDYNRLRNMLIDWYASLRTIVTIQKNASDAFSQTNFQLNELFKSFGYTPSVDIIPLTSKANFFLDLVNFYKIKGTPNAIANVLEYYGFSDININEYWLLKNNLHQLVFRSEKAIASSNYDELIPNDHDITYENMIADDPHWYYTQQQIEDNLATNLIQLPSKSPYFSLTTNFYLERIRAAFALMSKVLRDEYERYSIGLPLLNNLLIKNTGIFASLSDIYIATIYSFNKIYGHNNTYSDSLLNLFSYNKPLEYEITLINNNIPVPINLEEIYKSYIKEILLQPKTRLEQKTRIAALKEIWEFPTTLHYLQNENDAETILNIINPSLKNYCDLKIDISSENKLLYSLIATLDAWIKTYIATNIPSVIISILGFSYDNEINKIIDFFKPYRARLAFIDEIYVIKDPLHESIIAEDILFQDIYENIYEHPTPHCHGIKTTDGNCLFDTGISDDSYFTFIKTFYIDELRTTDNFDEDNEFDSHYIYDTSDIKIAHYSKEIIDLHDVLYENIYQYSFEHSALYENSLFDMGIVKDNYKTIIYQGYIDKLRTTDILNDEGNEFDSHYIYDSFTTFFIENIKEISDIHDSLHFEETFFINEHSDFDDGELFDVGIVNDQFNINFYMYYKDFMRCDGMLSNLDNIFDNFNLYEIVSFKIDQIVKTEIILSESLNKKDVYYLYDHPNYKSSEYENYETDQNFNFDEALCDDKPILNIYTFIQDDIKMNQSIEDYNNLMEIIVINSIEEIRDSIEFSDHCDITII